MSKRTQPSIQTAATTDSASILDGQALGMFTFSHWIKNANATGLELMRFATERLNKDLQFASRFATCRRPEDFFALQSEMLTSLIGDYAQESSKLLDMQTTENERIALSAMATA